MKKVERLYHVRSFFVAKKTMGLSGPGANHKRLAEMVGNYVAVATADLSICNSAEERDNFIGLHLVQQLQNIREQFHAAFQNAMHLCNGNAIVDNGNVGSDSFCNAVLHLSFI